MINSPTSVCEGLFKWPSKILSFVIIHKAICTKWLMALLNNSRKESKMLFTNYLESISWVHWLLQQKPSLVMKFFIFPFIFLSSFSNSLFLDLDTVQSPSFEITFLSVDISIRILWTLSYFSNIWLSNKNFFIFHFSVIKFREYLSSFN